MLPFAFLLSVGIPSVHAADSNSTSTGHVLDLRFETTTFVLNLEKQGLEDNTFTNGIGRDTTLIGDLVNATLHKRLPPRLDADLGVFANIPFGHDTEVSQVRPIARLTYRPVDQVSAQIGTLKGDMGEKCETRERPVRSDQLYVRRINLDSGGLPDEMHGDHEPVWFIFAD